MDIDLWLAFVIAYAAISAIPGPSVLMVVAQALSRGRRAAFLCIAGDVVGGFVLIALSLFGVGAILAASATLFQLVKWAGVAYMAWLGWVQIRDARRDAMPVFRPEAGGRGDTADDVASARMGFLVGVLNPKAIMFHVAFLSQFLDPQASVGAQFAILVLTSTIIVGGILGTYALLADRARRFFRSERMQRRAGYAGGGFLLGGSALMATTR